MNPRIQVVQHPSGKYLLRIHLSTRMTETLRFDSEPAFTKREADFRAMMLACDRGFDRDELPTHPYVAPVPKEDET